MEWRCRRRSCTNVTDAVSEEVRHWQSRPLEAVYPIVYVDGLVIKVRENQRVINKALHLVLGVNLQGHKELLGMWIAQNEGAKFWLSVFTELQSRGIKDIFITCMDGLTGLPEAVETVFPQTRVLPHSMVDNSDFSPPRLTGHCEAPYDTEAIPAIDFKS